MLYRFLINLIKFKRFPYFDHIYYFEFMKKKTPQWLLQNVVQFEIDTQLKKQLQSLVDQLQLVIQQSKMKMHKLHSAYKDRKTLQCKFNSFGKLRKMNNQIVQAMNSNNQDIDQRNLDVLYQIKHEKDNILQKVRQIDGMNLIIKRKQNQECQIASYIQQLQHHKIQLQQKISNKNKQNQIQKMRNLQLKNRVYCCQSLINAAQSKNQCLRFDIQQILLETNHYQQMKEKAILQQQILQTQCSQIIVKIDSTKQLHKQIKIQIDRSAEQSEKLRDIIAQQLKRKQQLQQKYKIYQYRIAVIKRANDNLCAKLQKKQMANKQFYEVVEYTKSWVDKTHLAFNYQFQHAEKMLLRNYF